MSPSQAEEAAQVSDCIRREILAGIPPGLEQLTVENVEAIRGKLHALRYFCAANGMDEAILQGLAASLTVTHGLWELLEQNSSTFIYLRQMENIRQIGRASCRERV